jgi:hypothetical protein
MTGKPPDMEVWRRVTQVSRTPSDPPGIVPPESGLSASNGHGAPAEASSNGMSPEVNGRQSANGSIAVDSSRPTPTEELPERTGGSDQAGGPVLTGSGERVNPVERVMSFVIRKLAWSRLSNPRVAPLG